MHMRLMTAGIALVALMAAAPAGAQEQQVAVNDPYADATADDVLDRLDLEVTPRRGQDRTLQRADEEACVERAASQLDTPAPVDEKTKIGAKKGALGGAAAGLLIGAITGHTVTGAVVGAGTGAVAGSVQKNRASKSEEEARAKAAANAEKQARQSIASCLTKRGYRVTSDG